MNLALAAIGLGNCSIHHLEHHRSNVHSRSISFNIRNDGLIGHVQRKVAVNADFFALGRDFYVLVHGAVSVEDHFRDEELAFAQRTAPRSKF